MHKLVTSTSTPPSGTAHHVYRLPAVLQITGWSKSTLYTKMQAGIFPRPFKPDPAGRAVTWDGPEVDENQRLRISQRDRKATTAAA
jgi:prophage regulatory protein